MSDSARRLTWAALIPAVAMIFIDQTIVAIAVPEVQKDLALSATGIQWVITGYLISFAALVAFGGRLGDILGHKRMVMIGVAMFATASLLCGLTPEGGAAEAWLIAFRVVQGFGAALLFPGALTLVLGSYPPAERGRAVAIFFISAGLFTAIGPIAGGFLSEWTWRSIFWVNVPVAILSLALLARARPPDQARAEPIDFPGLALIVAGMGLLVLGFQQSSDWGWGSVATWGSIVAGAVLLAAFVARERRVEHPLIRIEMLRDRSFSADALVVLLAFGLFVPLTVFASMYSQISLEYSVSNAGLYLAIFFGGFALGSRWGGALLDRVGVKRPSLLGGAVATAGFIVWGMQVTDLSLGSQWYGMVITGAGLGMVISPTNTDGMDRVGAARRGEAAGVLMTMRNFGSAVGLAVLGTILITRMTDRIDSYLESIGAPQADIDTVNESLQQTGGGDSGPIGDHGGRRAEEVLEHLQADFADATQLVLYIMAGVMVVSFLVALTLMRQGKAEPAA
jgi:EmrB/QacA subfamily drug resistance transporter